MKNRSKSYTRHHRERIIRKKWAILKNVFKMEDEFLPVRGSLSKGKVHCSCRTCRYEQYHGIPKAKYKVSWRIVQEEMDD